MKKRYKKCQERQAELYKDLDDIETDWDIDGFRWALIVLSANGNRINNMKWNQNTETLATTGFVGDCPYYKSNNTDYNAIKLTSDDMGYVIMWCNNCKRSHILANIMPELKTDQLILQNLII